MKAYLILEDGSVFEGESIGAKKDVISEIVFNTSMTGYLEILTDPSYAGQAIVMTYPLIGNYGVAYPDMESKHCFADAYIIHELAELPSNFRSEDTLEAFLLANEIPGIVGVDTRALTKRLREKGTMNGLITTNPNVVFEEVLPKLKEYRVTGVVRRVTCLKPSVHVPSEFHPTPLDEKRPYTQNTGFHVALLDFGSKENILRCLLKRGCTVTVYPAYTSAEEVLAGHPDGIMLSNGPGDPAELTEIIAEMKKLYDSNVPIFAICLGHQLMALATGCETKKMKWGHRGANHPVKDLTDGRVYMSSQNHGYMVVETSVKRDLAELSFINANDGTVEGLHYIGKNIFTVQFHPEACSGPQDTEFLFDKFMNMMEVNR
ncbi:MAG: carbamoyl phosphate synthase small subunit [Lachnospiraceae bacterium]